LWFLVFALLIAAPQEFEAFGSGMISCFFLKASHRANGTHSRSLSIYNSPRFPVICARSLFARPELVSSAPRRRLFSSQSLLQRKSTRWLEQLRKGRAFNASKKLMNLARIASAI
jgi:hypothetical protein